MIVCLWCGGAGFCAGQEAGADRRTQGTAHCRVEAPAEWVSGRITWIGECKNGYADGLGALRQTIKGMAPELFLGRVDQGKLVSGVLAREQGSYTAGRWEGGSAKGASDGGDVDRNTLIAGFEDGAKAADAISRSMKKQSKAESARFYARLAKKLRSQMD
jgi:hypothetical protein